MTPWFFPIDPEIATPEEDLAVFNISPNWKSGVTETLSWLTDINISEQSVEQRRTVRRYPRRSFEYSFLRELSGRSRIDAFLAGMGKKEHLVPLWHEQFNLGDAEISKGWGYDWGTSWGASDAVERASAWGYHWGTGWGSLLMTNGATGWGQDWGYEWGLATPKQPGVVKFPYTPGVDQVPNREFDVGDLVMITTMDLTRYAILHVTSMLIEPGDGRYSVGLTASRDIGRWPKGSRVVPLRVARIMDDPGMENMSDRVSIARIRWTLSKADDRFEPDWGGAIRRWQFKPDRQTSMKVEYSRQDFVNDFQAGVIDLTDPGDRVQITQSMVLKFFGRNAVWKFRRFLYAARGKCRSFLLPTFMHDLQPIGPMVGATIDMMSTGFSEYFEGPQAARVFLIFEFNDGTAPLYRRILGVEARDNPIKPNVTLVERFLLDTALPLIEKSNVERISFVMPVRFDQDTIEIFHATDNSAAVSSAVVFRSCEITE